MFVSDKGCSTKINQKIYIMNDNIEKLQVTEVLTSKKNYIAPSIRKYGDITNLVNARPTTGSDGGNIATDSFS